jgi:hypothetical protein
MNALQRSVFNLQATRFAVSQASTFEFMQAQLTLN